VIGQTISHYKIYEKLGEGGMGVVYKAEDTSLRRAVALKFLPPALLAGEEEKKRFVREAQAAAALNHPNIATVFAIDEAENHIFIALEFVEGRSLDKEMASGPKKLAETLDIATQICEGLQAAHQKGIVHRDIKSQNIMVTNEGHVKMLDFGLAKLKGAPRTTKEGKVVGTIGNMSPEQMRGDTVDERTDIWAVGVLLYEMISGLMPFAGDYEQAVAYRIMNEDPNPLTAIRTGVPIELDRIVAKAMAKDPKERYQHVDEMLVDLKSLRKGLPRLSTSSFQKPTHPRRALRWRGIVPWSVAGILTIVVGVLSWKLMGNGSPPTPVLRFMVPLADGAHFLSKRDVNLAISRSGHLLAYTEASADSTRLCIRSMDDLEARRLPGTEGARGPFFSPDEKWIGFSVDNKIQKLSLLGGAPVTIFESIDLQPTAARWAADDSITFGLRGGAGLWRISAAGGKAVLIQSINANVEYQVSFPEILPRSEMLFTSYNLSGIQNTDVVSSNTGKRTRVCGDAGGARYLPTGHILYARMPTGDLCVAPFDLERLKLVAPGVPVVEGVQTSGMPQFAVSESGTLAYVQGGIDPSRITLVERNGKKTSLPLRGHEFQGPRFSPDGKKLLYTSLGSEFVQWIYDLEQGVPRRFSEEGGTQFHGVWTRDGSSIIFNMHRQDDSAGIPNLYSKPVDGRSPSQRLTQANKSQFPCSISPDGKTLLIQELTMKQKRDWDLMEVSLEGNRVTSDLLRTSNTEIQVVLSPDGRLIAYASDESGLMQIYVRPYHGTEKATRVSSGESWGPLWSRDGKELFFAQPNPARIVAVTVEGASGRRFGKPRILFEGNFDVADAYGRTYDLSPDGKRFAIVEHAEPTPPAKQIVVVLNWFEELKRKLREKQ
jgi:serine/threonine protein kinase